MPFSTYSELKTAIANFLYRDDIADDVGDIIALAEEDIGSRIQVSDMEATTTLTLSSGSATLPTDYAAWRKVQPSATNLGPLDFATPSYINTAYNSGASGTPRYFTIEGGSIRTAPSSDTDIVLDYYAKIPALSDTNTSNWLLAKWPSVYLYGALVHSASFFDEQDKQSMWGRMFERALEQLRKQDEQAARRAGGVRLKSVTP